MAPTLAQAVAACCVLGGSALTVDHRKPTSGCSPDDWSKLTQHFAAQRQQFSAIQPHLESAYQAADVPKAFSLLSKITPKYCGQADLLQTDSFPPQFKFSALQKCIRKSQGVSVGCAACFPQYLESMVGKNGALAPHSCMAKCAKVTPTTAQCLSKVMDPAALKACLSPTVQKNSLPCAECSKPRLVRYAECMNMGFLNAEVQLNSLITTIRGEKPVAILDVPTGGDAEGATDEVFADLNHTVAEDEGKAEGKAQDKAEDKAEDKTEDKAEDKAEEKAEDKAEDKAVDKAEDKAEDTAEGAAQNSTDAVAAVQNSTVAEAAAQNSTDAKATGGRRTRRERRAERKARKAAKKHGGSR